MPSKSHGHMLNTNAPKLLRAQGQYIPPDDPPPDPPGGDSYWEPGDADLPLLEPITNYPTSFGTEWFVDDWASLVNAVDNSVIGDLITIDADAARIQPPISTSLWLPAKGGASWSDRVTIRSSRYNLLPALPANGRYPGAPAHVNSGISAVAGPLTVANNPRVRASHVPDMAKLRVAAASGGAVGNTPFIRCDPNCRGWYIWGLDIDCAPGSGFELVGIIRLGENGIYTVMSEMPKYMTIQQCRIHSNADNTLGNPANFKTCRKAIYCGGSHIAVINSVAVCEHDSYGDDNAFYIVGGQGPYLAANSDLHGSGENILTGGSDMPAWHTDVYSDITIRHNHLWKPDAWATYPSKNPLELKQGKRVLIEHNLLDGNFATGQAGQGLSLKTVNQADGGGLGQVGVPPETGHVTFRLNKTQRVGSGYVISCLETGGGAAGATGIALHDVTIYHNLTDATDEAYTGTRRHIFITRGNRYSVALAFSHDIKFRNETFLGRGTYIFADPATVPEHKISGLVFDSLIFAYSDTATTYGVKGGGVTEGNNTIAGFADVGTLVFTRNIITARTASMYDDWAGNFFPANDATTGIDPDTGVLGIGSPALAGGSMEGRNGEDNGADIAAIVAGLSGVNMEY